MTAKQEDATQEAAEAAGLPKVSKSELDKARKEGILEAAREAAKDSFRYATDGNLPGEETTGRKYANMHDIMQWEPLLKLGLEEFQERLAKDAENPVPEEKAAGLLELERSGQNRTQYVQALMKRLDIKTPYEVTQAGPGYTNDVRPVTTLVA